MSTAVRPLRVCVINHGSGLSLEGQGSYSSKNLIRLIYAMNNPIHYIHPRGTHHQQLRTPEPFRPNTLRH